ncbi:WW domain-binding protein 4-like [Rhagoletis pomonella]|uniref:WW domain-binding protein 4-like n=1 Tax=Rhagoletis pomonella TaxID=28610 RepID=UPI001782E6C7|nr:WW domain-binding protein 4-like [Rhagoletis pomonella]
MADYWKSNDRKYCDFCKCWISDNKASIAFHESGKRHKQNVANRITDISRNSEKAERERKKMDAEIRKMEEAAMRSYAQDIHGGRDFTARTINAVLDASNTAGTSARSTSAVVCRGKQVDPVRLPGNSDDEDEDGKRVLVQKVAPESIPNASLWVEGVSDEGYTYYWNVKTNESVWDPPKEGYLSYAEYQRINELALKKQKMEHATEAKKFRENVNEEVARYNRERLKMFRKPETPKEAQKRREEKEAYKTQDEAAAPTIGAWQVVEHKPPPKPVDLELPKVESHYVPPVVSEIPAEPPVKRFKEKTIVSLDPTIAIDVPTSFKKRKFAAKANQRQRLDVD